MARCIVSGSAYGRTKNLIETTPNLYTLMDTVIDILTTASSTPLPPNSDSAAEKGTIPGEFRGDGRTAAARSGMRQKVTGVVTERGRVIPVRSVVLTTGTFLGGRIFIGEYDAPCGRVGEPAAYGLTESLHRLGFTTGRLKTGTPPRILRKSVDFSKLDEDEKLAYVDPVIHAVEAAQCLTHGIDAVRHGSAHIPLHHRRRRDRLQQ